MPPKHLQPGDEERRKAVGAKIRATRTEAGIGLRELARDLGMSPSWLLGVESGEITVDAMRLGDIARRLGYPVSYLLDEPDYVEQRQRQLMTRPATRLDWQLMYAGNDERARAHFELDKVFKRLEEERGSGASGPAGRN